MKEMTIAKRKGEKRMTMHSWLPKEETHDGIARSGEDTAPC